MSYCIFKRAENIRQTGAEELGFFGFVISSPVTRGEITAGGLSK